MLSVQVHIYVGLHIVRSWNISHDRDVRTVQQRGVNADLEIVWSQSVGTGDLVRTNRVTRQGSPGTYQPVLLLIFLSFFLIMCFVVCLERAYCEEA